jgi:hypothetical protein
MRSLPDSGNGGLIHNLKDALKFSRKGDINNQRLKVPRMRNVY